MAEWERASVLRGASMTAFDRLGPTALHTFLVVELGKAPVVMGVQQLKFAAGDPRRPGEAKRYLRPVRQPDDAQSDPVLFGAMLGAAGGFLLKIKLSSWAAVLCCLSALANVKSGNVDVKNYVTTIAFAVISLVTSYLTPPR
ncbi:hypothetical protein WJX72_003092 [[Myrmecia] bisecta]|uniref:Protein Asterix n=1 Tax=[Myrmecia] bisecta TaxID=41462 RepID=A0AAW1PJS1_9CHLO